jgi:hypothetical protein
MLKTQAMETKNPLINGQRVLFITDAIIPRLQLITTLTVNTLTNFYSNSLKFIAGSNPVPGTELNPLMI